MNALERLTIWWVAALILATSSHAAAAPPVRPPAHVQIVLDTSGSMADNDPQRLSVLAAMLFTDLAAPTDSLGILGMALSRGSYVMQPLGPVGEQAPRIKRSFREMSFSGGTDCSGPLQDAGEALRVQKEREPGAEQFVIFLSDGLCSDQAAVEDDVGEAARDLSSQGVRVFTIGLFPDDGDFERDPSADLSRIASITEGEYFRVKEANDIPARFADILGMILGSQALPVSLGADGAATLDVDDYLVDASLVLTSSGSPATASELTSPNDRVYRLPSRKPPFRHIDSELTATADENARGRYYEVVRLEDPAKGEWKMQVANPEGARALLIQNYALDPVLELPQKQDKYKIGESISPTVYLRSPDGSRIADTGFLDKVQFTLSSTAPDKSEQKLKLKRQPDGSYTGTLELEKEGKYTLSARASMKSGGLDKSSADIEVETMALELKTAPNQGPIDIGTVKAGTSSDPYTVDLSASKVGSTYDLTIELEMTGDGDIENTPDRAPISPSAQTVDVVFEVDTDHPGGPVEGQLEIRYDKQMVRVPVRGEVIPLTFWERFGKLVMTIGAGLLGLIFLIFILLGFVRPHDFPPGMRLKYSDTIKKLQSQKGMPV